MLWRFIGDAAGDGPDVLVFRGIAFPKGEAVAVDDAAIVAKLTGNWHFDPVPEDAAPEPRKRGRPRKVHAENVE